MIDLTVDPYNRVVSYHDHLVVSTKLGISIICSGCGNLRNMFPFGIGSCGVIQTGQMFQHCTCMQEVDEQYLQVVHR